MKTVIYFDICALILLIGIIAIFYIRKNTPCIKNTLYKLILWLLLLSTVLSITVAILQNEGIYIQYLSVGLRLLFYYTHTTIPFAFFLYCVVFIDDYRYMNRGKQVIFLLPIVILELVISSTPFTHWIFYFNDDGVYCMGKFFLFSYLITLYYIIMLLSYITINRKKYKKYVRIAFYTFIIFSLCPMIIQLLLKGYLLENFAGTISALILLITVESLDTLVDGNTSMYTQNALLDTIDMYYNSNMAFEAVVVKTAELELIIEKLGLQLVNTLFSEIAAYLKSVGRSAKSYYINNECFVLLFNGKNDDIESMITKIQSRMKESWMINDLEIKTNEYVCRISVPKDAASKEIFFDYIRYIQNIKKSHNNRIEIRDINLQGRKRRLQVENAIKYALDHDTFEVYYQPIFSFEKEKIISAEALVRLTDPEIGIIGPDEFIGIAEENSTIIRIGKIVFEKVCRFISTYDITQLGMEYVEINLSILQCMHTDLVTDFKEIIERYHVNPKQICLEITETATDHTPEILEKNLEEFQQMGIVFALDDYGTGYSNLQKMIRFPFSYIKYDKRMIWSALSNHRAKIAVDSSMNLIKKLNMKVIAEGIETVEQLEQLSKMDCDYIQGYYFSKAIPEEEFIKFCATRLAMHNVPAIG